MHLKRARFHFILTVFLLPLLLTPAHAQRIVDGEYRFGTLDLESGLSQGMIFCMLQDSKGLMWFGTKEGLNRYDGYSFTVYRNIPGDSTSLSDNQVYSLAEDARGRLWIGTRTQGLEMFDPVTEQFTPIYSELDGPESLLGLGIQHLVIDSHGYLWIGGWRQLLARVDTRKSSPEDIRRSWKGYTEDLRFLSSSSFKMMHGPSGEVAVLGDKSMWRFNSRAGRFERMLHWRSMGLRVGEPGNEIVTASLDQFGILWLSLQLRGHFSLLPIRLSTGKILDTLQFEYGGAELVCREMTVGPDSIMYVAGSYYFMRYDPGTRTYTVTPPSPDQTGSLRGGVSTMVFDRSGNLWIGTTGLGIHTFNPRTLAFHASAVPLKEFLFGKALAAMKKHLAGRFKREDNFMQEAYPIRAPDGGVWCTTPNFGLLHYDPVTGKVSQFGVNRYDPYSFLMVRITSPFIDSRGRIWIGNSQGISRLVDTPEQWQHYFFEEDGPDPLRRQDKVTCIHEDTDGTLWMGTLSSGVAHFDPSSGRFTLFPYDLSNRYSISADHVLSIAADPERPERYLWIGTDGGGLNRFDKKSSKFERFGLADGLPNMVIYGIIPDSSGQLWMSTNNGISCLKPSTMRFTNFNIRDGLQDNEFNRREYYHIPPLLYFGGVKGHNSFNPVDIKRNTAVPAVVITGLRIFNRPLSTVTDHDILPASVPYTKAITLNYDQNMLTIEFAALDYTDPHMNMYRYRMEGLDKKWIEAGNSRSATYTYLDPGQYTFRVLGSNNHGVWNETGATLRITILPPWWRTVWAYVIYVLVLGLTIFLVDRSQRRRVIARERERAQTREAELRAEAAEFEARAVRAENERNEQELRVAATIQKRIIPQTLPELPGYEIAGINLPAHEIGGDYYDCIPISDDRYALVIADVTGKGVPASLLVSSLHASLLVHLDNDLSLEDLARRLNAMMYRTTTPSSFVTFILAILHPPSGTIEMINAGHNPAIVRMSDGTLEVMEEHGLPLGCSVEIVQYVREVRVLMPGEGLLFYTDGIPEAMDDAQNPFGQEALEAFLADSNGNDPATLITGLVDRLASHRGAAEQSDDITMLYIRRSADTNGASEETA